LKTFFKLSLVALITTILTTSGAFAFGPHDDECTECHSIHDAQGAKIIGVKPLANLNNPATGTPLAGNSTLCLGCHNEDEGIIPINLEKTHPVGMKPIKVNVPKERISSDGTLVCRSCHDPHPANPNYKYLIENTNGGKKMGIFCQVCHPDKRAQAEPKGAGKP
jgi:predicted CXXCH cytochrome family protein